MAIVVRLAWQKLAGKEIPANANDPRWRRRDALHFHGKTKGRTGQKILLPPNFTASLFMPNRPAIKVNWIGVAKKATNCGGKCQKNPKAAPPG